jgi:hypothetical protein
VTVVDVVTVANAALIGWWCTVEEILPEALQRVLLRYLFTLDVIKIYPKLKRIATYPFLYSR